MLQAIWTQGSMEPWWNYSETRLDQVSYTGKHN